MRINRPKEWARSTACVLVAPMLCAAFLVVPADAQQVIAASQRSVIIDGVTQDLTPFRSFAVGPSGTIAIAQAQDHQVRFFGSSGSLLTKFGRTGEGPGEFRNLMGSSVGSDGKQFWIISRSPPRVTLTDDRGGLLGGVATPVGMMAPSRSSDAEAFAGFALPIAFGRDSTFVVLVAGGKFPAWLHRNAIAPALVHVAPSGTFKNFIVGAERSDADCTVTLVGSSVPLAFCPQPLFDIRSDAGVAAVLHVDKVQSGRWSYHWALVNVARGDTVKSASGTVAAVRIPSRIADSARTAQASSKSLAPPLADAIRQMQLPEYYPPIRRIIVAQDNAIWLEEATSQSSTRSWRWIDLKSAATGVITVPAVFSLVAVLPGQLWGYESDADGVQSVVRYSIPARR